MAGALRKSLNFLLLTVFLAVSALGEGLHLLPGASHHHGANLNGKCCHGEHHNQEDRREDNRGACSGRGNTRFLEIGFVEEFLHFFCRCQQLGSVG